MKVKDLKALPVDERIELVWRATDPKLIHMKPMQRRLQVQTGILAARSLMDDWKITAGEYAELLRRIETPAECPPDPKSRTGAILSGAMNAESKAILLCLLGSDPVDLKDLKEAFTKATDGAWKRKGKMRIILEGYLSNSLYPNRMIKETVNTMNLGINYSTTEFGSNFGQPLAMFGLEIGGRYDLSLNQVLGGEGRGTETSAPYIRFFILSRLLEGDAKIIDLSKDLGVYGSTVRSHLEALERINFIEYESNSKGRSHARFTELGRKFSEEFVRKVEDAVAGGNELKSMANGFARNINMPDSFIETARKGLGRYLGIAAWTKARPAAESKSALYQYLSQKGAEGARPVQIEQDLGSGALMHLTKMVEEGFLLKTDGKGTAVIYSTNPNKQFR